MYVIIATVSSSWKATFEVLLAVSGLAWILFRFSKMMRFLSACFCWEEGRSKNFLNNLLQLDDGGGPETLVPETRTVFVTLLLVTADSILVVELSTGATSGTGSSWVDWHSVGTAWNDNTVNTAASHKRTNIAGNFSPVQQVRQHYRKAYRNEEADVNSDVWVLNKETQLKSHGANVDFKEAEPPVAVTVKSVRLRGGANYTLRCKRN